MHNPSLEEDLENPRFLYQENIWGLNETGDREKITSQLSAFSGSAQTLLSWSRNTHIDNTERAKRSSPVHRFLQFFTNNCGCKISGNIKFNSMQLFLESFAFALSILMFIFSYFSIYRVFKKTHHFSRCWYLMVIRRDTVNTFCFSYIAQKCMLWAKEYYFLLRSCSGIVIKWKSIKFHFSGQISIETKSDK